MTTQARTHRFRFVGVPAACCFSKCGTSEFYDSHTPQNTKGTRTTKSAASVFSLCLFSNLEPSTSNLPAQRLLRLRHPLHRLPPPRRKLQGRRKRSLRLRRFLLFQQHLA